MKFFNFFSKKKTVIENLPDLIRKIDKNELIKYKSKISLDEKVQDPLYMRIKVEEIDYINQYYKELNFVKKFIIFPLKKYLANSAIFNNLFRYEKNIYRPNVNLRLPHFDVVPDKYKMSYLSRIVLFALAAYLIGYTWSRLKYDIYFRRFMYCYCFSWMMLFELLDYKSNLVLRLVNSYLPIEMSDKELEFLLYKKIRTYLKKRNMREKVDDIINTDPELLEIEQILRRLSDK